MSDRTGSGPAERPPELSAAQRRAVTEADPSTGRLTAVASTCAALVAKGLAVAHRRSGHFSHYLSTEGRALRDRLAADADADAERAAQARDDPGAREAPASGGAPFQAATGTEVVRVEEDVRVEGDTAGTAGDRGDARDAEVATAWAGLLEIRRFSNDGDTALPAPWERARMVDAVALALESAGMVPCAVDAPGGRAVRDGYRVTGSDQPGAVRVGWHQAATAAEPDTGAGAARSGGPVERLEECSRALAGRGWQPTRHTDRWGDWFLLVSARRS